MTDKFTSASVIHSHLPFISHFPHFRIFHICTLSVFHAVCLNYLRIFICRKSKYIFAGESIKKIVQSVRREKLMGRRGTKRRKERDREEDRERKRQRESGRSKPFRSLHLHDERRLKSTRRAKKERKQQRSGFRSNFNWTHKRTHTYTHTQRGTVCRCACDKHIIKNLCMRRMRFTTQVPFTITSLLSPQSPIPTQHSPITHTSSQFPLSTLTYQYLIHLNGSSQSLVAQCPRLDWQKRLTLFSRAKDH